MRAILTILLLLISSPCWAFSSGFIQAITSSSAGGGGGSVAPAYVQSWSTYSTNAISTTGVTAHNALIAGMGSDVTVDATVSGGCNVAWVNGTNCYGGAGSSRVKIAYCSDATGGDNSISLTSAGGDFGWSLAEYSGLTTAGTLEGTVTCANYTTTDPTVTGPTTTDNNSLVFAVCGDETNTYTLTPGAGWSERKVEASHWHDILDHIQTTAGATSMATTRTASASLVCNVIAFKAAAP